MIQDVTGQRHVALLQDWTPHHPLRASQTYLVLPQHHISHFDKRHPAAHTDQTRYDRRMCDGAVPPHDNVADPPDACTCVRADRTSEQLGQRNYLVRKGPTDGNVFTKRGDSASCPDSMRPW